MIMTFSKSAATKKTFGATSGRNDGALIHNHGSLVTLAVFSRSMRTTETIVRITKKLDGSGFHFEFLLRVFNFKVTLQGHAFDFLRE